MSNLSDLDQRALLYATTRRFRLKHRLGFGKDGMVFSTSTGRAVKIFASPESFHRELACYQRLSEASVHSLLGHAVPQLLYWSDEHLAIEMTIVHRPFLLDFASAYLDDPPDFPPDVLEQWTADKQEEFGPLWPRVQLLLDVLQEQYGIFLLDVHPGNVGFKSGESP